MQLSALGLTDHAIKHRVARGGLHPLMRGVYAVGRPEVSRHGWWIAAVLCFGDGTAGASSAHRPERASGKPGAALTALSHRSAAALWGFIEDSEGPIEVSVQTEFTLRRPGIRIHRRPKLESVDVTVLDAIPVTTPSRTLVDLGALLPAAALERAVNEADRLDLISPDALRRSLPRYRGERGVGRLRALLDRRTFRLTDSELERRFLRLVDSTGLPRPLTGRRVNGFKVDFFWPELGLVVETDGLRYHRTPAQQARDRLRDQAHTAAGLTQLRFTHAQVRDEPERIRRVLRRVAGRLAER